MNFRQFYLFLRLNRQKSLSGFTLVEMLIVSVIVGVMAAIAVPSWVAFLQRQQLNQMAVEVETILRQAQHLAKKNSQGYRIDFQMKNGLPQYSIYPNSAASPPWQKLTEQTNKFSLNLAEGNKIILNHDGSINDLSPIRPDEKITLYLTNVNSTPKRCVIIRTLLGVTEIGRDTQCD